MSWSLEEPRESLLIGSTLVEGSTLSEGEAREVLAGRTVQGHSVEEHRELINYQSAVSWLIAELEATPYLSTDLIVSFHRILMDRLSDRAGRFKASPNYTVRSDGSRHRFAAPEEVPGALREWVTRFNEDAGSDPAERAAALYYDFEHIHPFDDGNGRVGRILLAYWLHWKTGRGFRFRLADRLAHLDAMEAAKDGDMGPLAQFVDERSRQEP